MLDMQAMMQIYFNSNMVRLKAINPRQIEALTKLFQFQYGAIKRIDLAYHIPFYAYFNSNMVRLKVDKNTFDWAFVQFQFQYGAIKRYP